MFEQFPTRRAVDHEVYAPDFMHKVTFGSAPRYSLVTKLVDPSDVDAFINGYGRYESMKTAIEISSSDFYKYLRLGISSQAAMALRFLGHETPESLTEHQDISKMLPDVLAGKSHPYPQKFIDRCEEEGVSPIACQLAIRRGITDEYLDQHLTLRELIYVFQVHVKKTAPVTHNERSPLPIDYICDGTIPFESVIGGDIPPHRILSVGKEFAANPESDFVKHLRSDPKLLRKFIGAIREMHKSTGLKELRAAFDSYGEGVLELTNPYLATAVVFDGDGEERVKRKIGLETARYIEETVRMEWDESTVRHLYRYNGELGLPGLKFDAGDFDRLYRAGVPTEAVCQNLFNNGVGVDALITATEDGIATSLMSGAL